MGPSFGQVPSSSWLARGFEVWTPVLCMVQNGCGQDVTNTEDPNANPRPRFRIGPLFGPLPTLRNLNGLLRIQNCAAGAGKP